MIFCCLIQPTYLKIKLNTSQTLNFEFDFHILRWLFYIIMRTCFLFNRLCRYKFLNLNRSKLLNYLFVIQVNKADVKLLLLNSFFVIWVIPRYNYFISHYIYLILG
uniref:Uncharacterized protein n=1 Tax=Cacopsylla melanoneura TaxID=428564 RepID=A0A8D9EFG8_9HEMI